MRIGLQTWGTEGDVRPFFALAGALRARGHDVRLVTTNVEGRTFPSLAQAAAVDEEAISTAYFAERREEIAEGARENFRGGNPIRQLERILTDALDPVAESMLVAARDLAAWASFVVVHPFAHMAVTAAEAAARPYATLTFAPLFPTRVYPPIGAPNLGRFLNPALWWIAARAMDGIMKPRVNALRATIGLPAVSRPATAITENAALCLLAMSPALLPRPADWSERFGMCGFLEVVDAHQPGGLDPALRLFLDAGAAPAFFSFGSMANLEPTRALAAARAMIAATAALGLRAVIQIHQVDEASRAALPAAPHVHVLSRASHAELFPRCALIVHHGGAGTTHTALRAGRPSLVVPHVADQFFWGDLLWRRGLAARPVPARKLDEAKLREGLRAIVTEPEMAARTAELGAILRAEDSARVACDAIERAAVSAPAS